MDEILGWSQSMPLLPCPVKKRGKNRSLRPWPRRYVTSVYTQPAPFCLAPPAGHTPWPDRSYSTSWHWQYHHICNTTATGFYFKFHTEIQAWALELVAILSPTLWWDILSSWCWRGSSPGAQKPRKPNCAPHPPFAHCYIVPCDFNKLWPCSLVIHFR